MNTYRYFVDGNTVKSFNIQPFVYPHHSSLIEELEEAISTVDGNISCVTKKTTQSEFHTDAALAVGETVARRFYVCVLRHETKDDFGTTINYTILEN